LWDPRILALEDDTSEVSLRLKPDALAADPPPDLAVAGPFASSKERIVIPTAEAERTLHLPRDTPLACLRRAGTWMPIGTVGQHPAALVGNEEVVFAFDPTDLIARYLNMMDTTVAADVLDWMAGCALRAVGFRPEGTRPALRPVAHPPPRRRRRRVRRRPCPRLRCARRGPQAGARPAHLLH
jgi:hypothetical protein